MTDVTYDLEQIRKYLLGRLSEDERLLFQDRLARDPRLVRELEQTLRMRQGLQQLHAEGYFARRSPRMSDSRTKSLLHWLPLAAAAVIAVVCVDVGRQAPPPLLTAASGEPASQLHLVPMRGPQQKAHLPPSGNVEFRARPETLTSTSYRVTLLRDKKPLGSVVVASVDADGYLDAYAESARLAPGDYSLQISSDAGDALGVVDFTLLPPEARPIR
jgi:hypothetical protein